MNKLNKLLSRLKISAFEMKESGQMPTFLFTEIAKCGVDVTKEYYEFLMYCCEKLIRVRGFYRKYSIEEHFAKDWFYNEKKERGFN